MTGREVRRSAPADAAAALVHAARTSRAPCASCSNRRPSPAPRCWSTAASTCAAQPRDVMFLAGQTTNLRSKLCSALLQTPATVDCRRLFLRDYEVWINIGVHDFEKRGEQRVLDQRRPVRAAGVCRRRGDDIGRGGRLRLHPPQHHRRVHGRAHPPAGDAGRRPAARLMLAHPRVRARACRTEKPDVYPTASRDRRARSVVSPDRSRHDARVRRPSPSAPDRQRRRRTRGEPRRSAFETNKLEQAAAPPGRARRSPTST